MDFQNENQYVIVNFNKSCKFENISNNKKILSQALSIKKNIIFNVSEVNQIDTASIQLLVSFVEKLKQQNITWQWRSPSLQLIYISKLLGCHQRLNLPD